MKKRILYTAICPTCGADRKTTMAPGHGRQEQCEVCLPHAARFAGLPCEVDGIYSKEHGKCAGCEIFFGPGHLEAPYKDGKCRTCYEAHKLQDEQGIPRVTGR